MKRIIALLLAALMLLSLTACSSEAPAESTSAAESQAETTKAPETTPAATEPESTTAEAKALTPAEIEAAIAKAIGEGYLSTEEVTGEDLEFSVIGAMDRAKIKDFIVKQAVVTATNLDKVVIVQCEDGYADEAVALLNEDFAQALNYVRQYPFGVAKVEGARLYKVDNTVMFIIGGASADPEATDEAQAELADAEYAKIDKVIEDLFGSVPENLAIVTEDSGNHGGLIGG